MYALIELISSIPDKKQVVSLANDCITPKLLLLQKKKDRKGWLKQLTAEQIALVLHLQQQKGTKYAYPLDQPLLTKPDSIQALSIALACTSKIVYPRCHVVWNTVWMNLTEESDGQRKLKAGKEYTNAIKDIIQHVVVENLLGQQDGGPILTNERQSLALQIVCTLCGSSDPEIVIPTSLIESVLCKEVVDVVFLKVLTASVRMGKMNSGGNENSEHHLKPLTTSSLNELVNRCCESGDAERQFAFANALLLADPLFDKKTKTNSVASIMMMYGDEHKLDEEEMKQRNELWEKYLSFLEEGIVTSESTHIATSYIDLMYRLAKYDLTVAPANAARRVMRFFMSAAFYDFSNLSIPSSSTKKKGKKKNSHTTTSPLELSSGLRINELLESHNLTSISLEVRKVMAARFYSSLSDFTKVLISQTYRKNDTEPYGKVSKPETIYKALAEMCDIAAILGSSGAQMFNVKDAGEGESLMDKSRESMLKVQAVANKALVDECDGNGDAETLRAKSLFATSCASLMMTLYMQLSSCGNHGASDNEADEEDEEEDVCETLHEFIADLADTVGNFCEVMEGNSTAGDDDDEKENPLAAAAGLLVNILSSAVGGEDANTSVVQESASKLTRETVKLMWSGIIATMNALHHKQESINALLNDDVMTILIESVCGEEASGLDQNDNESIDDDDEASSDEEEMDNSIFVNANKMDLDLDEIKKNDSNISDDDEASLKESEDESVELDPSQLENMLLEDSDVEMDDSGPHGVLEHHAGADKALAQLIKLKQEARKASQAERERMELRNQLRCATFLLDPLFAPSVFKNSWIPIEAVLGSLPPLLRYRKAIAKSIQSSTSSRQSDKGIKEKNNILDKLSMLVKDRLSKYRCRSEDSDVSAIATNASKEIVEELKRSVNSADCSCGSIALITSVRCITNFDESEEVKNMYTRLLDDWATRKTSKIHSCVFNDVIKRLPSLASVALITPLSNASQKGHSAFIKCESIRFLAATFHVCSTDETLTDRARCTMKESCSIVAKTIARALTDSSLEKAKRRGEVMSAAKQFVNFIRDQKEGILTESELSNLKESLSKAGQESKSKGTKQMSSKICETISVIPRRCDEKIKRSKSAKTKTPKSTKKRKTKK